MGGGNKKEQCAKAQQQQQKSLLSVFFYSKQQNRDGIANKQYIREGLINLTEFKNDEDKDVAAAQKRTNERN